MIFTTWGTIRNLIYVALLTWLLLAACSCTKPVEPTPTCQRVYFLSDKYRIALADTMYMFTDSLWPWGRYNNVFCGQDTLQFKNTEELKFCGQDIYEIRRFVIGDKKTTHKVF